MGRPHSSSPRLADTASGCEPQRYPASALPIHLTAHLTLWRLLGERGTSLVYEARDRRRGARVAVKMLALYEEASEVSRRRLQREAELYAQIDDPRVPSVYEVAQLADGTPYVVMEYVSGQALSELLVGRPLSVDRACEITGQMLSGLDAIHRQGVVHRDIKPVNIIVDGAVDGRKHVRLVDFGVAKAAALLDEPGKLTQPGVLLGTPQYMAPEQFSGLEADARTDLYAVALVLYEMLSGTKAHAGDSLADLLASRLRDDMDEAPLVRARVPGALIQFLRRSLARPPELRFSSAVEMSCELLAARAERDCVWSSAPPPKQLPNPESAAPVARSGLAIVGAASSPPPPEFSSALMSDAPRRQSPRWTWGLAAVGCVVGMVGWTMARRSETLLPTQDLPRSEPTATAEPSAKPGLVMPAREPAKLAVEEPAVPLEVPVAKAIAEPAAEPALQKDAEPVAVVEGAAAAVPATHAAEAPSLLGQPKAPQAAAPQAPQAAAPLAVAPQVVAPQAAAPQAAAPRTAAPQVAAPHAAAPAAAPQVVVPKRNAPARPLKAVRPGRPVGQSEAPAPKPVPTARPVPVGDLPSNPY